MDSARQAGMLARAHAAQGFRFRLPPLFDRDCLQLKREWRKLARRGGQSDDVKALERRYHSVVRAKKRKWLLTPLDKSLCKWGLAYYMA